jgi:hypothetical protein
MSSARVPPPLPLVLERLRDLTGVQILDTAGQGIGLMRAPVHLGIKSSARMPPPLPLAFDVLDISIGIDQRLLVSWRTVL